MSAPDILFAPNLAQHAVALDEYKQRAENRGKILCSGAAIFSTSRKSESHQNTPLGTVLINSPAQLDTPRVLLVRRVPDDTPYGGIWEIPGGEAELSDKTFLDTVSRETFEETGQTIIEFINEFEGFEWEWKDKTYRQINFSVKVRQGDEVVLAPDEHDAWVWASLEDVGKLEEEGVITPEMGKCVKKAFEAMEGV